MFIRKLKTKSLNSSNHNDLKLIWDLGHKTLDLFHQPVNAAFIPGFQQSGDGQGSNAAVRVRDEVL